MTAQLPSWRKLAAAAWSAPSDPQFYGDMDVDAAALLAYIERVREATGVRLTMTHLVGRAVARALTVVPELRVRPAPGGRVRERESVDVFFIINVKDGKELSGVKVCDADRKTALEIAEEVRTRREAIHNGDGAELDRGKSLVTRLPLLPLRMVLRLGAWLTSDLNLDLSWLGMPRQAFGGAMVTSVGMWGVRRAFSPLAAYYKVPVLVLIGAVEQRPVVVAGEVIARPMMTLTATFDHRYTDGYHAARFAEAVREYCADPTRFEPVPLEPGREGRGRRVPGRQVGVPAGPRVPARGPERGLSDG
ncbi:hypothetical protein GCM10010106_21970 [Thermopolyspora flexuosa]|jgi:pyruvate dehydrogenase E2 component (dihydrolipoamide acetyltransferase)|uniref:Pyruvate dehydrogenase E2 component (Dihydrolipoamide acetyltransferase) n=1 Tax=Thermopolyspora flexuosa TaxID=103836 RepID=A0A543J320_9ACTN|nr:2-oxo acid dehydrogenase subunit E2 [Thermopolyspora flexuosa]TQM77226.1 pyruvate dehydrogenase E2 component (dihydrolipoamide acetyltransferase) [Thermopolyspora flexuosa]GGM75076.1 hypothetical protein GCM10010106_21970 [Thermopolyspora flexuosa]